MNQKKRKKSRSMEHLPNEKNRLDHTQKLIASNIDPLKTDEYLSSFIPETKKINEEDDIWSLLDKYHHVILKPFFANPGADMMEVTIDANDQYAIQHHNDKRRFPDKKSAFNFLKNTLKLKNYIVQQFIDFVKIENRVIDLKIMMRWRKSESIWKVTERYVEAPSETMSINRAITLSNLKEVNTDDLIEDIDIAALKAVQRIYEATPKPAAWGLNMRIDSNGKLWIIEVYSKPGKVKGNKQKTYDFLTADEHLSQILPETKKLSTEKNFWLLLNKYRQVILKPNSGSLGTGIIKVFKDGNSQYEIQYQNETQRFTDRKEMLSFAKNKMKLKPYIVQQYVPLARIEDRPFDLRVIVQRKKGELAWEVTGLYAKLAWEGFFTTNLAKKGEVLTLNEAIDRSSLNGVRLDELLGNIDNATLKVAQELHKVSPCHRMWGLDMGIDSDGKLWIIEVNSKPGIKGFKRLENKKMYETIQKYKRGDMWEDSYNAGIFAKQKGD